MASGAAALVVDRIIFPSANVPASALAQDENAGDAVLAATLGSAGAGSIPDLPFPRTPAALGPKQTSRDLFAPFGESIATAVKADNHVAYRTSLHAEFAATHSLQAVLIQGDNQCAVINKKVLRTDDSVGGCTITAIGAREVQVRCPDGDAILRLPEPARQP